jgi:NADH-quinone oxidoreductase subunit F
LPLGVPFKELMALAGGVWKGRKLKAVIPGGSSCPVLPADVMWATNMDYDSVKKAGSSIGTGAVIVMDETTCMVRALERLARFYMSESCGQCTPCREGTGWIEKLLIDLEAGRGNMADLDRLISIASNMEGNTICVLADSLSMPVKSFVPKYKDEFIEHVKLGRCPFRDQPARPLAAAT